MLSPALWYRLSGDYFHFYTLLFSSKKEYIVFLPAGKSISLREGLGAGSVPGPLGLVSHFKAHTPHPCHCSVALLVF